MADARLRSSDCRNLHDQDTGREHLSATSLTSFLNCPQRWDFRYLQHLELVDRPAPLALGSAFQFAIEHNDPLLGGGQLLQAGRPVSSQQQYDFMLIQSATVTFAAQAYLKRWPAPAGELREYPYRVQLRNPWTGYYSRTFDLLGFADGLREHESGWELIENKLVGQIGQVAIRRLPLDRQLQLLCYGVWRATGKPVTTVSYRFTRKPSIKQRKGDTVDEFLARLQEDYETRWEDFYTHEETLYRATDDLLRTEMELWVWADAVRRARVAGFSARNSSHCQDFGGCPYIPLCVGDPDAIYLYRKTRTEPDPLPEEAP